MNRKFKYKTNRQFLILFSAIISIILGISSCDKMTDNYKEYLEGGEIIYPGKADSIKVYPGKYRLELQWLLKSDPSITSALIYWNNKEKSREVSITHTPGIVDTVKVVLEEMEEQTYTFEIFTLDQDKNRSVASEVIGTVYGDKYRSTLFNRAIRSLEYEESSGLEITWETADAGTVLQEVSYTDTDGLSHLVSFDAGLKNSILEKFDPNGGFELSTIFKPDSLAIDTFKTAFEHFELVKSEKMVDRSSFSLAVFPGDYSEPNAAASIVNRIWTNANAIAESNTYISLVNGHALPQWFTIDLGKEYELTRFKLFQRGNDGTNKNRLYAGGNLKDFEIWGAFDPDVIYNPDDHGGDFGEGWVLLQSCTVNRPSGNTIPSGATRNDNTDEDVAVAVAGHEYPITYTGKVRYLRIKTVTNWDSAGRGFANIASIALWGMQY